MNHPRRVIFANDDRTAGTPLRPGINLPLHMAEPKRADSSVRIIYDPHHYANSIEGSIVFTGVFGVPPVLFLPAPSGRRNLLVLSNIGQNAGGGSATVLIGFGSAPSFASPIRLAIGDILGFDISVPQDDLYASISNDGNGLPQVLAWNYSVIQPPEGV